VFDLIVELDERLDPPGKDSFRPLESFEPFQAVVVGAEDYVCP